MKWMMMFGCEAAEANDETRAEQSETASIAKRMLPLRGERSEAMANEERRAWRRMVWERKKP
jgi:hypothetical protein